MAKTAMKIKQQRKQKLQYLWTSTFCFKKVRNLQNLLP